MSDTTSPASIPANASTPAAEAPAQAPAAKGEDGAKTEDAAGAKAKLGHRLDEVKASARKMWTDARQLGERARAEASKVTTRGRARWSELAPRARELSDKARTRVRTVWTDQVAGARAGLARVRAAFKRA